MRTEIRTKQRRNVTRRSRNGCLTCKFRKVRCDETRPSCTRCLKYGINCRGYSKPAPKSLPTATPKPLQPKISTSTSILSTTLFRQLFRNEQEYHYFNIFCTKTCHQFSGHFSTTLWQTLILQASQHEPLIRHAIIALGALTSPTSSYSTPSSPSPTSTPLTRRQFAYTQYHHSITLLRTQMSTTHPHPQKDAQLRTTLLACLLFSIFEIHNNYISTATTQIYSGLKLLLSWQRTQTHLLTHLSSISSPRPLIIEDELIHAFSELEIEAMCRHDVRSDEEHDIHRFYGQVSVDTMPTSFGDVGEARVFLVLIAQRALHLCAWMKRKKNGALGLRSPDVFARKRETEHAVERMKGEYERWEGAFEGLWNGGEGVGRREWSLRVQLLTARLWQNAMGGSENCFYGDNTELLTDIVDLCREILKRDGPDDMLYSGFGFEGGLITALRTVGFVYRHRMLKREAIELLLDHPWKEGLWDSYMVGTAMKWLADLEDMGLDDGVVHVPEENVLRDFTMVQDEVGRRTVITGLQALRTEGGGEVLERRELIIPWL